MLQFIPAASLTLCDQDNLMHVHCNGDSCSADWRQHMQLQ